MPESIGSRVRTARKKRGLTQAALAKAVSVDQTAISKLETGTMGVEDHTLGRISDALGVSLQWLKTGEGQAPGVAEPELPEDSGARRVSQPWHAFEEALDAAFDKSRGHRLVDVDAVRAAFAKESVPALARPDELVRAAQRILDAAAMLRAQNIPVTLSEVLVRVAGAA